MRALYYVFLAACGLMATGCVHKGERGSVNGENRTESAELILPMIPDELTETEDRAAFLALHFWEAMDFSDSTLSQNAEFMEQNFAEFISLFPLIGEQDMVGAVREAMERASVLPSSFKMLGDIAELYLADTESPYYDEDFYRPFAEEMAQSALTDDYRRIRYEYQSAALAKNRRGSIATDFTYETRDGKHSSLHETPGERLLVMFYDPDCQHCQRTIETMKDDTRLKEAMDNEELNILAIYAEDEHNSVEGNSLEETGTGMPKQWTVGRDRGEINREEAYSLRVLPTFYLLDGDKRVIKRSVSPDMAFR